MGWDSVCIATEDGPDGLGIRSRWGKDFPAPGQTIPGSHPVSCTTGTWLFSGLKWLGCGSNDPPLSTSEVKERVKLYLCSPSVSSWQNFAFNNKIESLGFAEMLALSFIINEVILSSSTVVHSFC